MAALTASHLSVDDANRLAVENLPLVDYAVAEIATRLPHHVDRDEIRSAAMVALVQAARAFDPGREIPFSRFAKPRLRGAILDELREHDWLGRTARSRARQRTEAEATLTVELGRHPTSHELAARLGVAVDVLASVDTDVHRAFVLSIERFTDAGTLDGMLPSADPTPEESALQQERVAYLMAAVHALPARLRHVIEDYYLSERPAADTARELGVTESRVSQMRAEALVLLREGLAAVLAPEQVTVFERPTGCVARRRRAYYAAVAARLPYRASA